MAGLDSPCNQNLSPQSCSCGPHATSTEISRVFVSCAGTADIWQSCNAQKEMKKKQKEEK